MLPRLLISLLLIWSGPASGQQSQAVRATELERQGKLAEAAEAWQAVLKLDPKDAVALASLGFVRSKQQKYDEAAAAYRSAAALTQAYPASN